MFSLLVMVSLVYLVFLVSLVWLEIKDCVAYLEFLELQVSLIHYV